MSKWKGTQRRKQLFALSAGLSEGHSIVSTHTATLCECFPTLIYLIHFWAERRSDFYCCGNFLWDTSCRICPVGYILCWESRICPVGYILTIAPSVSKRMQEPNHSQGIEALSENNYSGTCHLSAMHRTITFYVCWESVHLKVTTICNPSDILSFVEFDVFEIQCHDFIDS